MTYSELRVNKRGEMTVPFHVFRHLQRNAVMMSLLPAKVHKRRNARGKRNPTH